MKRFYSFGNKLNIKGFLCQFLIVAFFQYGYPINHIYQLKIARFLNNKLYFPLEYFSEAYYLLKLNQQILYLEF